MFNKSDSNINLWLLILILSHIIQDKYSIFNIRVRFLMYLFLSQYLLFTEFDRESHGSTILQADSWNRHPLRRLHLRHFVLLRREGPGLVLQDPARRKSAARNS